MTAPRLATFGCRLNAYESEAMKGLAQQAGLGDAVIVNTCAVTAEAVRQARQAIRRLRRENPQARMKYDAETPGWTLYWFDRNSKAHLYEFLEPGQTITAVLDEVEDDPTCIF